MTRLGELLRLYRVVHEISVRDHAAAMGLHPSTLSRIEHTDSALTSGNFLKVLHWLLQESPRDRSGRRA
jgi:transcriptional regulator with XRE-family HTH domain